MPNGWVDSPLAFVSIADDGTVTIVCHRSEMGQGVRTGMPMIVADELEADWKRVRVAQAPGDEKKFGNQDTDGSRSTRHFFEPMRRCGAAARMMLEAAAAEQWNVPVSEVAAKNHEVVHKPERAAARLRRAREGRRQRSRCPRGTTLRLKDPKDFRYIGKGNLKLVDAPRHRRPARRSTASTRGCPACSTRSSLGPRSSAARWRASTTPRRSRCPAW